MPTNITVVVVVIIIFVILHSLRCTEASLLTEKQTFNLSEQKYVNLSAKQSKTTISQETEKILTWFSVF